MITVTDGPNEAKMNVSKFPGGEMFVRFVAEGWLVNARQLAVTAHLHSSDDILLLLNVMDALRRLVNEDCKYTLVCPYLPYARQDREMVPGEALSLKVMTGLINNLEFDRVFVWDAHSPVALALLNNVTNVPPEQFLLLTDLRDKPRNQTVLVSPDAGALKKIHEVAHELSFDMVRADKIRDVKTTEILETKVYSDHIGDRDFLIVDDICDGGRTFIELAKVLRPLTAGKVMLYVTHGIFSKGTDVLFDSGIDHIYTPNLFGSAGNHSDALTIIQTPRPLLRS